MTRRYIEMIDKIDGGVFAVFSYGEDGFGQIHVGLLKELLDAADHDYEEVSA